jgi:hypothetical protein
MEQQQELGTRIELDDVEAEYEKARQEARENSKFVQLDPDTAEEFEFTGVVYARHSTGTDNTTGKAWERDVYDFELEEATPKGEKKVLSFGKNNAIVPQLTKSIKEGKRTLTVSRSGTGALTRYKLIEVKARKGKL